MHRGSGTVRLALLVWIALAAAHGEAVEAMAPAMKVFKAKDAEKENLLRNGGFEQTEDGRAVAWEWYDRGYELAEEAGRDGGAAIRCTGEGTPARNGARQVLQLDQTTPVPILVRGWSRARNVGGTKTSGYSVYVDLIYGDGTPLWAQTGNFSTGTHGWQMQEVRITPVKPVKTITVYALFRGLSGEVWFDDFEVHEIAPRGTAIFDMIPVQLTRGTPGLSDEIGAAMEASTADGLTLEYDWENGRVTSLSSGGRELLLSDVPSGFLARDVAADSDVFSFQGGECPELALEVSASFEADAECIRVSGSLIDRKGGDRAVALYFALPLDAAGWQWHDDVRHSRTVEAGREYANLANTGTGANGSMSLYPLGCIGNADGGLALALDMGLPAQYRIGYSGPARQFFIAYDLGLSPDTDSFPSAAPFKFVIFRTDPQWGFRAAVKKLYEVFPEHFLCRSRQQGIWMPFTDVSTVQGWEDFGFRYHEGINNVPFDDGAGILSFRYTEPSTWWFAIDPDVPRTRENVTALLQEAVESGSARRRRQAEAALVSGSHDADGQLQYLVRDTPWTNGVVFSLNANPRIPGNSEAAMYWNDGVKRRLYGPDAAGEQDGEYLDSLEAYVTATENFRREHFRCVSVPLTFATDSKRPVIHKAHAQYEFTKWIAEDVHGMGKLMFANSVPERFAFLCPWLDVMGCEMDWLDSEGRWRPPSDERMNLRRTMCYRKPYLILMNTRFERFTPDLVEKYFQRSLFYGIWPSMFSHNASDDPYWQTPEWYNRDRHLFKRYIPLVRLAAEAGWEPVTHAVTDNGRVYVERFGPSGDGRVYLTLLNDSAEAQDAALTIDAAELGIESAESVADLVSGEALKVSVEDGGLRVAVEMAPEQVRLIELSARPRTD